MCLYFIEKKWPQLIFYRNVIEFYNMVSEVSPSSFVVLCLVFPRPEKVRIWWEISEEKLICLQVVTIAAWLESVIIVWITYIAGINVAFKLSNFISLSCVFWFLQKYVHITFVSCVMHLYRDCLHLNYADAKLWQVICYYSVAIGLSSHSSWEEDCLPMITLPEERNQNCLKM